ncbi:MAG: hypothetical protein PHQ62_02065 [Clostridia bacterium]|nr:hypothetical protein [Clostridia bacterium]
MTKKIKNGGKFLAIFSCLLSFALCLTLADFFSSIITVNSFANVNISSSKCSSYSIFAISMFDSTIKSSANEYANNITKIGGAGYVWQKDSKYYVLASAYLEENDANLVKTNLESKDYQPSITKIDIGEITINNTYVSTENTAIFNALNIYKVAYSTLYDISVALDTSVSSETDARLQISDLVSEINKTKVNFNALFDAKLTTNLLFLKLSLNTVLELADSLVSFQETNSQTFSSKIKFNYLSIIYLNQELSKNLSAV